MSWELTLRNSEERGLGDAMQAYVVYSKATPNEEIIISKYIHYGMVVSPLCEGSLEGSHSCRGGEETCSLPGLCSVGNEDPSKVWRERIASVGLCVRKGLLITVRRMGEGGTLLFSR